MHQYERIKKSLARGWNTWNSRSVLSHVLLPQGFALNLAIKEYKSGKYLKEALIGRMGEQDECIQPGPHAYDGSYTRLNIRWEGIELDIQTAVEDEELVILVEPLANQLCTAVLVIESGMLWGRQGMLTLVDGALTALLPDRKISVHVTGDPVFDPYVAVQTPYIAMKLNQVIGISTGKKRSVEEIRDIVRINAAQLEKSKEKYQGYKEEYNALQTCMAWNTVYEPKKDRVVTTVSRIWNVNNGGYILFCWDTYFAALMASLDSKELAYANAIEITREKTHLGFVPNSNWGTGLKSLDRSQPPVGSFTVRELYRRFREKWLLEELFEDLYTWNTWFYNNRQVRRGLLAWGSNPYEPIYGNYWETAGVGQRFGGALESGLDNSPVYDDIPFHSERHLLELADVGLTSLYILDCSCLADIAGILNKDKEASILHERAESCRKGLQALWNEDSGIFQNMRTDTGMFSSRLSPMNFYPLFTGCVTGKQAQRMVDEHFYNPSEFWGEWILPSISRNDPAYPDQDYWRGRIWAPLNFLVYIGFRYQGMEKARRDLARKSGQLLLKEWLENGHVHENYNADMGIGCDHNNSDRFYHWGALLSYIVLMEAGFIEGPESEL